MQIDFSGALPEGHQSEDEELALKKHDSEDNLETKYSLKQYNKDRKARLAAFNMYYKVEEEEEEQSIEMKVSMANKLEVNCFGNLEISLMWEEKLAMLIRIAQLYTVLFVFYYE